MSSPERQSGERPRDCYAFGDFTLDVEHRLLWRDGEEVMLRRKSFDVLVYLVNHHGQVVTKATLMEAVWPNTTVIDNSLTQCIVEIRRALEDDSQRLIETVARRGYLFAAPIRTPVVEFSIPVAATEPRQVPLQAVMQGWKSEPKYLFAAASVVLGILAIGGLILFQSARPARYETTNIQITNFTDSAVGPAVSADGRMVAFLRSDNWISTPDQIYVKWLPNGEPMPITHDPRRKCCVTFSPDGSRLAYATQESGQFGWRTFTVSVLGGDPSLLLSNAEGLTWLDPERFLFSEFDGKGFHMGIVTARADRSEYHQVYFPQHERAMVHFSYASPDRRWALALEMDPIWQPCRVVPLDGGSAGWHVGPSGRCTSAAWSPDGKWMYFGVEVGGAHHLWRQRFPHGQPEQMTFGPTQEDGLAVMPDGQSLITSIGMEQAAVWIHDAHGERPVSSEGHLAEMHVPPYSSVRFSADGKSLFYLMRYDSPQSASELWRTDLESGRSETLLHGMPIVDYDVSNDGTGVVFSTQLSGKPSQIWLAPLDRSSPPKMITAQGGAWPHFGPEGQVLFQWSNGNANYLVRIGKDGSGQSKVTPYAVGNVYAISPDRRWIALDLPSTDRSTGYLVAVPAGGGDPRRICRGPCVVQWAPDGKFLYVGIEPGSQTSRGKTVAIPVAPGQSLPDLPASGIRGVDDAKAFPGARILDGWDISPGLDPSFYAYVKTIVHRNLYRIGVP